MVRAAVATAAGEPVKVRHVVLPEVGAEQVRVRIEAVGVCHSDLSMVNGTLAPKFPLILGHEAAGIVVEVGERVTTAEPGDHVVINWAPACRRCWWCLHGQLHLCKQVEGVVATPGATGEDGSTVYLEMGVGAMADEVVVAQDGVIPVDKALPLDQAALLGCAVMTGAGAVLNAARVRPGESVLVTGLGGVGLSAIAGAKLAGATQIIAMDTNPEKEAVARRMGATDFVAAGEGSGKAIRALAAGRGPDHGLDCVGIPATIRETWRTVRRGGQATIVGVGPADAQVSFSPLELFHFDRVLTSSIFGSGDPARDVPVLAERILRGQLDITPLITDHIALDDVDAALNTLGTGASVRSVVRPA
ncbi:MAG TPA: alcohol dehydrogenase catalytic domain-containing protein [Jatrophihabitantaceae bacterium]|jgi:S-(hydroxymethyl)glutathione dehydrogenase/alcohol dehydrogenase